MRMFIITAILTAVFLACLPVQANAGQAIYQQLHESTEMENRCMERIEYYSELVDKFSEDGDDPSWYKHQWCSEQLRDWESYCNDEYVE